MWQWFMRFNVGRRAKIVTAFIAVGMIVVLFLHFHDGFVLTLADRARLMRRGNFPGPRSATVSFPPNL